MWTDLTVPTGEIDAAAWFPTDTDDGEARIEGYIAAAELKTADIADADERDIATATYAYHLAYVAIWLAMSGGGTGASMVNEESYQTSKDLIENFRRRADEKLAEFEDLVPPELDDVVETAIPPTMSTPVTYGW